MKVTWAVPVFASILIFGILFSSGILSSTYFVQSVYAQTLPSCPTGTTYNPTTDLCEVFDDPLCPGRTTPTGETVISRYDPDTDSCDVDVFPFCPPGSTFDFTINLCTPGTPPHCRNGSYNPVTNQCPSPPVVCPLGEIFIGHQDRCENGGPPVCPNDTTYDQDANTCTDGSTPVCSKDLIFNPELDVCASSISPTCPSDKELDPESDRCGDGSSPCPTGTTFNPSTNLCEVMEDPSCLVGTLSPDANQCDIISPPSCPTDSPLNPDTDLCEDGSTPVCVIPEPGVGTLNLGMLYNTETDLCDSLDPCPDFLDSFSLDTFRCEPSGTTGGCPPPRFLNLNIGLCAPPHPTCTPLMGTLNLDTDLCEPGLPPSCTLFGVYDPDTNLCVDGSSPLCGTALPAFNPDADRCELSGLPRCPVGDTYNPDTNTCNGGAIPICSNDRIFNPERDVCASSISPTCPSGEILDPESDLCVDICVPSDEVCDGIDNNCDDSIDEGFGLGGICSEGLGICKTKGQTVCSEKGDTMCSAVPGTPEKEVCDGLDNDCDGKTDEKLVCEPNECNDNSECDDSNSCTVNSCNANLTCELQFVPDETDLDEMCTVGVGQCENSGFLVCNGNGGTYCGVEPFAATDEVCDGIDNDCDGKTDEKLDCDPGEPDKVEICHKGKKTLSISSDSVDDHIGHGDKLGECPPKEPKEPKSTPEEKAIEKANKAQAKADNAQQKADETGKEKDQKKADKEQSKACKKIQKEITKLIGKGISVPDELQQLFEDNCSVSPNIGDLVITEIMANPRAVSDVNGEWFELYNPTDNPIELQGLIISDDDFDSHTISSSVIIPAEGRVALGRNGDSGANGGATIAYVYSGINLGNSGDEIIITRTGTGEIDRVDYVSSFDVSGKSKELSENHLTSTDNDNLSNWCDAVTPMSDGDSGTPAATNDCTL